jgi:hypothetical protein
MYHLSGFVFLYFTGLKSFKRGDLLKIIPHDPSVQVADGVTLTLRGTNTQQNGDTMLRAGTFWRAFAANVVVGPEYTYTIEKVRNGSLLRLAFILLEA